MEFEPQYTEEQERFRVEFAQWLDENVPPGMEEPAEPADLTLEQYQKQRELGRRLGERGWLWPTAPQSYGGGGLDIDDAIIIEEEMDTRGLYLPPYYDSGGRLGGNTVLVWGSEEQKLRLLPPILRGEVRTWQLLSEPEAGSDLAGVRTNAVRDGDHYVINGQKIYIGSHHGAEQLWTIVCTDANGERHQNLSWFMIPSDSLGISWSPMELLSSGGEGGASSGVKNTVYFEDVRVPAENLIGGENEGWKVASTHLELEHGTGGRITRNRLVDRLIAHCKETQRDGAPLTDDPDVRERLIDVYIDAEIGRLFGLRNYWLRHSKSPISYEGPQLSYQRKMSGLRVGKWINDILGPYALTNDPTWGPSEGHIESHQRGSIVAVHPGATADIQKVIMSRRIGIGRPDRERAGALA